MWPFKKRCKHKWDCTGSGCNEPLDLSRYKGHAEDIERLVRGSTQWFWRCAWCGATTTTEALGKPEGKLYPNP